MATFKDIPEESLLNILCWSSAEDLAEWVYVNKTWHAMLIRERCSLSFNKMNLLHSLPAFIAQSQTQNHFKASFISDDQFEFENFQSKDGESICSTSSDGVRLIYCPQSEYRVENPVTRQSLELPSSGSRFVFGAIARTIDGKYKVLTFLGNVFGPFAWSVVTVGENMHWSLLSSPSSDCSPTVSRVPDESGAVSIGGIIYVPFHVEAGNENFTFAAIDLNKDSGCLLEVPEKFKTRQREILPQTKRTWTLVNMLNLLACAGINENMTQAIELWLIKDSEVNEWSLMVSIEVSDPPLTLKTIEPRIWFGSEEIMVMEGYLVNGKHIGLIYDVKTKKIQWLDLYDRRIFLSRSSLTPLFM